MKHYSKRYLLLFIVSLSLYSNLTWALPAHKRLWERKYGYSTSCMLCHSKGGGSQVGAYGEDFQRFGMTPKAFSDIEKRDSDKDGGSNIDEIKAKSNPGDPLSTLTKPGDWLSRIEESIMPLNELKKIFPDANKFSLLEGTLNQDQIKIIEEGLSEKLSEADSVPTFYFAIKNQNEKLIRSGVAIFSTPNKDPEKLIVGIGVDLSGKITKIVLIKNKFHEKLSGKVFLSQFEGKNLESSLQIKKGLEPATADLIMESGFVAEATKKALLTIAAVFNKEKKAMNTK